MSKSKEMRNGEIEKDFEVIREEKKVFNCEICGQRFIHKGSLNKHVASVHGNKKPFKCEICDYRFFQKSM